MTVNTTWVSPSGATLDLSNGTVVTETNWDALASDLLRLGGTDGNTKTGAYVWQIGSGTQTGFQMSAANVAHGVTAVAPTDVFYQINQLSVTDGGVHLAGLRDTGTEAIRLQGVHVTDDTTKTTASLGVLNVQGYLKSGTNAVAIGANANIVTFGNAGTTRFILDGDGDSHQDIGTAWTNFKTHDDVALLTTLSAHVTREDDPLKADFAEWLAQSREPLEKARIVTFNPDGHHFINWSRTHMLQIGAIIQVAERLSRLEGRLDALLPSPRD